MISRPKRGDVEDDILKMQEEFLKEKAINKNLQPAAAVTNLRSSEATKRSSDAGTRKPSKYALSKSLKTQEKKARVETTASSSVDKLDNNAAEFPEFDDDKVYFPKTIPSILGEIVEKNVDNPQNVLSSFPMPLEGFPVVHKWSSTTSFGKDIKNKVPSSVLSMDVDQPSTSQAMDCEESPNKQRNLPNKSYVLSSNIANEIHKDNVDILSKMSEKEILDEQQKLFSTLDPKLVDYLKRKRMQASSAPQKSVAEPVLDKAHGSIDSDHDSLWDNDILSHPDINQWLHFDSFEKDKLEWMRGIQEGKTINPEEPYEARFDFSGYLLPYTIEYSEKTKSLFHHGDEPHRPGYTLSELIELSRSTVTQQRVMALNTIAGILEFCNIGTYKNVIEIPISKLFFVIRFAIDENKPTILESGLKAMRNLLYNRIDEASLDALIGFEEGTQQPCLENDKSEIVELDSTESELKDFHLAEIDLITALLRTNIIQRLYYILDTLKPSFNCVQYSMQILTRLARDSVETANMIVKCDHLMKTIINYFVPTTGINFTFHPEIVYNGKPILSALKFMRLLSLQSQEINSILVMKYDILKPVSEYINSGIDGTYGLRIQIEAFCILTNFLQYNVGIEAATSLFPVIVTALYKHVKGTDIFISSSVVSVTHAAVLLQFINIFLKYNIINMLRYKEQIYPLLKEGVQKWIMQLSQSEIYSCGHLRILCSILDCCKTVLMNENITMKFLNELLRKFAVSSSYNKIVSHLEKSSNLLSGIGAQELHSLQNLRSLGTSVVDRSEKILPILNVLSPIPFLCSLFKLLSYIEDSSITCMYVQSLTKYLESFADKQPSLCDNWFTRMETDLIFFAVKVSMQSNIPEINKELIYAVSNKLCYVLRRDKQYELDFVLCNVVFSKNWITAEKLMNVMSLSDNVSFRNLISSAHNIQRCYSSVINVNYANMGPNIILRKWQEPILPRDWIYLPILTLYSESQEVEKKQTVLKMHSREKQLKELIVVCCLEWILFYEICFPALLKDIDVTDRFCRLMCVYLCDQSLFLDKNIEALLLKYTTLLFKRNSEFNFDKPLTGLHNFQDFYTLFLEQYQSVSYGNETFAACVLVPLAQRHNVKWRKLLWSEYAGCLRALDCPEHMLCYDINEYLHPEETDESLIKSYFRALSGNLLRSGTIAHRIAKHHVDMFKKRKVVKE